MMRTRYVILIAIFFSTSLSFAQDSSGVSRVGSLYHNWQIPYRVVVQGDYAYLTDLGCGLSVMYIGNPANPQIVGFTEPFAGNELAVDGNYAYVGGFEGFHIVNIWEPLSPTTVGFFDAHSYLGGIAARGNFVYIVDTLGFHIISVSNPANPQEVGVCSTPHRSENIKISGNYAYTTDYVNGRMDILDISNPTNPIVVGNCVTIPRAKGLDVSSNFAYVVSDSAMQIINISNPVSPQIVGVYSESGGSNRIVKVNGSYAYLCGGGGGTIEIVNISNPSHPTLSTLHFAIDNQITDIVVTANHAFVSYYSGFCVTSILNPTQPTMVANIVSGRVCDVAVSGDRAYLANNERGLRIVDISNRMQPREVGSLQTTGWVYATVAAGNYAFISDGYSILRSIDISNPTNPVQVDTLATSGFTYKIALVGGYAYVQDGDSIWIVNVSQPTNLIPEGRLGVPRFISDFAAVSNYVYAAAYDSGLCIYNVINPANPQRVAVCNTGRYSNTVSASGNFVYVADDQSCLRVYNVSNPTSPQEVFSLNEIGSVSDMKIAGNYLYTASGDLKIYNISNPINPIEVGFYRMAESGIEKIAVSGNYIYAAETPNFSIFDCSEALPVIERASNVVPREFALHPNFPNPFNATTTISYDLSETSPVKLSIYDITGKEVKTLLNFHQNAGRYTVQWDAKEYSSGTYLCHLQAGEHSQTQKLLLLK